MNDEDASQMNDNEWMHDRNEWKKCKAKIVYKRLDMRQQMPVDSWWSQQFFEKFKIYNYKTVQLFAMKRRRNADHNIKIPSTTRILFAFTQ